MEQRAGKDPLRMLIFPSAAHAMDLLTQNKSYERGEGTQGAYRIIREEIPYLDGDRPLLKVVETMVSLLRSEAITRGVQEAAGKLKY